MKIFNLIRLSFFLMSFGIMLGFVTDALSRVMIKELMIPSTIVLGLISLKELLAIFGVKVWAGNVSERVSLFGLRRTPYIFLGLLSCVFAFVFAPAAAYEVKIAELSFSDMLPALLTDIGLWKLCVIFLMFGFGVQVATTTYYALLVDTVGEKNIGKFIGVSWPLMVLTSIFSAGFVGHYLKVYTPERLVAAAEVCGVISIVIGLISLLGVEKRHAEIKEGKGTHAITFSQSVMLLSSSPKTLMFAVYIFISIFAIFASFTLMGTFGADVFGMPVGITTNLFRQYIGVPQLVCMLIAGFLMNRIGKKRGAFLGNTIGIIGFMMLIAAGFMRDEQLLHVSLVVIGTGFGIASVSNISMMMTMTSGQTGIYLGLWGTAESLALLCSDFGSGIIRDLVYHFSGQYIWAYTAIFTLQIIAFATSSLLLPAISKKEFEAESEAKMAELALASKG